MSTTPSSNPPPLQVENTIPVLSVRDLQRSIAFYRDVLGFAVDWGGDRPASQIASLSRDGHHLMIERHDPVLPGKVWIGCDGLVSLWNAVKSRGDVKIIQRPTNHSWALDLRLADPDGNVLWFGTEPLEGVPFGTEPAL